MPESARPSEPRSLADDLRSRPDAALVELLRLRPDLATPTPADTTTLAVRAATRASVQRALDRLAVRQLRVVEVAAVLPEPFDEADTARLLGREPTDAADDLAALHRQALLWGGPGAWRLVRSAKDVLGAYPAGLGPPLREPLDRRSPARLEGLAADLGLPPTGDPEQTVAAIAAHLSQASTVDALLAQAPAGARELLARLTWGPPVGEVSAADRDVDRRATRPLDWLLAHGLLAVVDPGHVVLPREIGIQLRGGLVHDPATRQSPTLDGRVRDPNLVDRTAGSSAVDAVRLTGELLEAWGQDPPFLLRAGGLSVRDLKRTATGLDLDEPTTAIIIEIAYAAGLLASDGEVAPAFAPTPAYDIWRADDPAWRWAVLAQAWLGTTRTPALVGSRDDRGVTRNALAADLDRSIGRELRHAVLAGLAEARAAAPGTAPDRDTLLARLRWQRPRRRSVLLEDLVDAARREAELLGVTGLGALSGPGAVLVALAAEGRALGPADTEALAAAVEPLLPTPVDHILLQADLTAVAPGPLVPELARLMAVSADVESRGGATVFRFSADSVRRALDLGWSSSDLLRELTAASRTPVPQPLTYLIEDVARRHGTIRVGTASAYLRSEDPSVLDEVMADRRNASLRLRRLAPTVIASPSDPASILAELREHGLAPVLESPEGQLLLARATSRRTPPRQPPRPTVTDPPAATPALLEAVVRSLREGDRATAADREHAAAQPGPRLGPTDPTITLAALRDATAERARVWIGYVDAEGRPVRRVVEPLAIEGGRVKAYDIGSSEVRTFSVHRITGVAPVDVADSR
ncbi:MAG: helicase-associated domain-containing protein [Actinomycetales bacterium]